MGKTEEQEVRIRELEEENKKLRAELLHQVEINSKLIAQLVGLAQQIDVK